MRHRLQQAVCQPRLFAYQKFDIHCLYVCSRLIAIRPIAGMPGRMAQHLLHDAPCQ